MVWRQSLWCGARVYLVESESMAFSQSLLCGARVYGVKPESMRWSHSLCGEPKSMWGTRVYSLSSCLKVIGGVEQESI